MTEIKKSSQPDVSETAETVKNAPHPEEHEAEKKARQKQEGHDSKAHIGGDEPISEEEKAFENKLKILMSQYVRLQADFDNFRRRTREEQARASGTITAEVLIAFLPVLDNFDLALVHMKKDEAAGTYMKGFELLHKQLTTVLDAFGVKEIEAAGKPFDPHFHEAVMQIQSDEYEDDTVSMVLQKGYMMKDVVLRPAKVQVAHNN